MSNLARAVAAVFRRKGAPQMPAAEFKHAISLDLRWFAPADARKLVERAVETGLLEDDAGTLRPRFDVARLDVPVSFRPGLDVLDEEQDATALPVPAAAGAPPADPAEEALREAAREAGEDLAALRREAADEVVRLGRLVQPATAALVVARRFGVDVRERAARLREGLTRDGPTP